MDYLGGLFEDASVAESAAAESEFLLGAEERQQFLYEQEHLFDDNGFFGDGKEPFYENEGLRQQAEELAEQQRVFYEESRRIMAEDALKGGLSDFLPSVPQMPGIDRLQSAIDATNRLATAISDGIGAARDFAVTSGKVLKYGAAGYAAVKLTRFAAENGAAILHPNTTNIDLGGATVNVNAAASEPKKKKQKKKK